MEDFLNKHQIDIKDNNSSLIGSGSYGVVYKGMNKNSNEKVAIKQIKIELKNEGIPSTALREICLLKSMRHMNIVE